MKIARKSIIVAWWRHFSSRFLLPIHSFSWDSLFTLAAHRSTIIQQLWNACCISILVHTWKTRNRIRYDNGSFATTRGLILNEIQIAAELIQGNVSTVRDLQILKNLNLKNYERNTPCSLSVSWVPPPAEWVKANTDGSARGSPGPAGAAAIFRNSDGIVIGTTVCGLGIKAAIEAEWKAVLIAMKTALEQNWNKLWIESDSKVVVDCWNKQDFAWYVKAEITTILPKFISIRVSHTYREANFAADYAAKHASHMEEDHLLFYSNKPPFVKRLEEPYFEYLKFM